MDEMEINDKELFQPFGKIVSNDNENSQLISEYSSNIQNILNQNGSQKKPWEEDSDLHRID
jgi:hypothetical protein